MKIILLPGVWDGKWFPNPAAEGPSIRSLGPNASFLRRGSFTCLRMRWQDGTLRRALVVLKIETGVLQWPACHWLTRNSLHRFFHSCSRDQSNPIFTSLNHVSHSDAAWLRWKRQTEVLASTMLRRRLCLHVFVLPSLELRTTLQFLRQLSLVGEKVKGCFHALHGLETRLCWACFHFLWSFCSDGPVDVRAVVIFVGSVFSDTLLHYVKKQVPSCLFCPVIARLLCAERSQCVKCVEVLHGTLALVVLWKNQKGLLPTLHQLPKEV